MSRINSKLFILLYDILLPLLSQFLGTTTKCPYPDVDWKTKFW